MMVLLAFTLLLPTAFSLQQISVQQAGFGESPNEIIITVHNTGDETLKGFLMYVDEQVYNQNNELTLEPKAGFQTSLLLEPGSHRIVCLLGDAESSLEVYVPPKIEGREDNKNIESAKTALIALLVILILVIAYFLIIKKPKLY